MRFRCPFCSGIVAVDNTDLGIDVQCGHCHEVVNVPSSRVAANALINDFVILEELGRGGMGVVYRAHQLSLDRVAAVKVLAETYASNPDFVVGFIKEARAAAKLNHPHIVQAYAVGEDEGIFYFAMEYVDGETMKSVLKRRKVIPVDEALMVIQQISEALDYAWKEQRLIHRDIKPDNIMITKNGRAKLADLGLAKTASDIDDSDSEDEIMGTPQYISPEHLTGAPMDVRSDIYSLGATLFHMVTGRFPFEGRSATEIARKHLDAPVPSPKSVNDKVPDSLCRVIEKMMAKNVNDRYQDAEELVDDLRVARRNFASGGDKGGQSGKGGLKLTTKGRKTGTFTVARKTGSYDPKELAKTTTTSTGVGKKTITTQTRANTAIGLSSSHVGTATSALSATSTLYRMRLRREQKQKKTILILAGVSVLAILVVVLVVVLRGRPEETPSTSSLPPGVVPVSQTTPDDGVPPDLGDRDAAYFREAKAALDFAKGNPDDTAKILAMGDKFFAAYPGDAQDAAVKKVVEELLGVYIPLDEERLRGRRNEVNEAQKARVEANKRRLDDTADQQRREEERRQLDEEARRLDEERKKREEQLKQAAQETLERRMADYAERLAARQSMMRGQFVDLVRRDEFKAARDLFKSAATESSSAPEEFRERADEFELWAKTMIGYIDTTERVWRNLTSGKSVEGTQVEVRDPRGRSVLARVGSVTNGLVNFRPISGDPFSVKTEDLDDRAFERLARRAAEGVGADAAAIFFMCGGRFNQAARNAMSDALKEEISRTAYEYFLRALKFSLDSRKRELEAEFGGTREFRRAKHEAESGN